LPNDPCKARRTEPVTSRTMQTPHNFWLRIIPAMQLCALPEKFFIRWLRQRWRTGSRDVRIDWHLQTE
ncbi:hypothetical protein P3T43_001251, partial [Paraburkholderia sp. GAS41]|uniref:hypothetical protein n=1 Tax=Paraburkholderia sp. GAS41 TaxID=3035134 RepID=UPI003D248D93